MRVSGGEFRGRKLEVPSGNDVRPTTDKVRQAIFNILVHEIHGARVLDIFSGSGSLGIEAVSRGAESVVFIEKHRVAIDSLRRNLKTVSLTSRVMETGWLAGIRELRRSAKTFDLIFADPPYGTRSGDEIAEAILGLRAEEGSTINSSLLAPDGILIIESSEDDEPVTIMRLLKDRLFDTTRISFYAPKATSNS